MSFDFLSAIKNVAPMIAGTFGTPLAGLAVKAICGFIPDPAVAADLQATQASDPGSTLAKLGDLFQQGVINTTALKQAELQHAKDMAELGYKNVSDLAAIDAGDRDSARKREMAVKDDTPAILAYTIIGGFLLVSAAQLIAMMGWPDLVAKIPQSGWLLIGNISGYLANEAKQAASYYFGTTSHNQAAQQTIADIAKAP